MYECMIKVSFLQGFCCNAIARTELEVDTRRHSEGVRVDVESSKVSNNKTEKFPRLLIEAGQDILGMSFKCNSIINKGR